MKINEVIRKYRKEQNLTQEQIATYLGVTAPAVNKWENGISYPDITLLAPIARILKIDVDTLLSFQEELTDIEINQWVQELSIDISTIGYQASFEKAVDKIKEFPTCDKLILYTAQILNAYMMMGTIEILDRVKVKKQVKAWYELVAFKGNSELANQAIMSLSQDYMTNGEYEEAQKLLDQVPALGFDKRPTQAALYKNQGNAEQALEIHESMLYQNANGMISSLIFLSGMLCEQKEYDMALNYADIVTFICQQLDLGSYMGLTAKLDIYMKKQDAQKSIDTIEEIVDTGIDSMACAKESKLYQHMKFNDKDGVEVLKSMLIKSFQQDSSFDFIRGYQRFQEIMKRFE